MKCKLYEPYSGYETTFEILVKLHWISGDKKPDLIFRHSAYGETDLVGFFDESDRWWWRFGYRRKKRTSRLRSCVRAFVEGGNSPQVLQLRLKDGSFVVTCHLNNEDVVRALFSSLQKQYNIY